MIEGFGLWSSASNIFWLPRRPAHSEPVCLEPSSRSRGHRDTPCITMYRHVMSFLIWKPTGIPGKKRDPRSFPLTTTISRTLSFKSNVPKLITAGSLAPKIFQAWSCNPSCGAQLGCRGISSSSQGLPSGMRSMKCHLFSGFRVFRKRNLDARWHIANYSGRRPNSAGMYLERAVLNGNAHPLDVWVVRCGLGRDASTESKPSCGSGGGTCC